MMKIGALSDTHGHIDEKTLNFLSLTDEIWHAGDIGNPAIIDKLEIMAPVRAVYGNIDGGDIRSSWPLIQAFEYEGLQITITHIGGKPGRYDRSIMGHVNNHHPDLFLCGHSHILKIQHDPQYDMLFINPGAAGKTGFHRVRTAIRFDLDNGNISNMEVHEVNPHMGGNNYVPK
ncbi:MAG: metallophosphoesterase family protein [Bacteroidales bacterium]|nr:metallophosphoesterase family protein [Bacteroidales bacterium]